MLLADSTKRLKFGDVVTIEGQPYDVSFAYAKGEDRMMNLTPQRPSRSDLMMDIIRRAVLKRERKAQRRLRAR